MVKQSRFIKNFLQLPITKESQLQDADWHVKLQKDRLSKTKKKKKKKVQIFIKLLPERKPRLWLVTLYAGNGT
jgi:hypothetical protein